MKLKRIEQVRRKKEGKQNKNKNHPKQQVVMEEAQLSLPLFYPRSALDKFNELKTSLAAAQLNPATVATTSASGLNTNNHTTVTLEQDEVLLHTID